MTLLAIDPGRSYKGDSTIGWATFDSAGEYLERGSVSYEELRERLELQLYPAKLLFRTEHGWWPIARVVCEDFVNNAQSKGGQRNGTSECIGTMETYCWLAKIPWVRQEPAALGPAKMHAPDGSFKKLAHLRHEDSAYLHGYEFLVRKGVLQSAGLSATIHADGAEHG